MSDRWAFTVYLTEPNVEAAAWAPDWEPEWKPAEMAYLVYQYERCPSTGRIHVQGYVRFHSRKRMNTVKNVFGRQDMHLSTARDSEEINRNYCTKEESRVLAGNEHGDYQPEAGKQGKRSDLARYCDRIRAGEAVRAIARDEDMAATFVRYNQGLTAFATAMQPDVPVARDVRVTVLWGPTGVGKTHRVMTQFPTAYRVTPCLHPWDGYERQETVVFDEFDYSKWTIQQMNGFLDKWPCELPARYRNRSAAWTRAIICSNSPPESWWPEERSQPLIDAFRRRLTFVVQVENQEQVIEL